jgi:hypothetical protein
MNNNIKIYHQDADDLSKNNIKVINNIRSNTDIDLANQLLAQSYLFLNAYRRNCLNFDEGVSFSCLWCKGCEGCKSDDGYCSQYCLHANDCKFSEFFVEKLEKNFKNKDK